MGTTTSLLIILLIILVAFFAYHSCMLNRFLPSNWQKDCGASGASGGGYRALGPEKKNDRFVGAMAQNAPLVPCAFPTSPTWQLNRCNYA